MRFKHFTTAAGSLGFMALTYCIAVAQDAKPNPTGSPVQSISSLTATNAGIKQTVSFALKPTAIAPPGASGTAQLHSDSISLYLSSLGPGVYHLDAVQRSNGIKVTLGAINIVDPTSSPSRLATDNKKEASANPESVRVETDASLTLPKDLQALDVTRILLMSGDNAVLDSQVK